MNKNIIHIIDSKKENAILIVSGSHELRRYPKENFTKNSDLISIFYQDIKELSENTILLFD